MGDFYTGNLTFKEGTAGSKVPDAPHSFFPHKGDTYPTHSTISGTGKISTDKEDVDVSHSVNRLLPMSGAPKRYYFSGPMHCHRKTKSAGF